MDKYYKRHRKKRLAYQHGYDRKHPKSKEYWCARYQKIRKLHIARTLDWYRRHRAKQIKEMRIYNKKYFSKNP